LYEHLRNTELIDLSLALLTVVNAAPPFTFLAFVGSDVTHDTVSYVQDGASLTPQNLIELIDALARENFAVKDVTGQARDRDVELAFDE
tara:strand:- start:1439 stop:1705 length:267 start_codon:yes stop_codon:yes gene_type:complete